MKRIRPIAPCCGFKVKLEAAALRGRRSEQQQAFLPPLSNRLRPLIKAADIQYQAACALGHSRAELTQRHVSLEALTTPPFIAATRQACRETVHQQSYCGAAPGHDSRGQPRRLGHLRGGAADAAVIAQRLMQPKRPVENTNAPVCPVSYLHPPFRCATSCRTYPSDC